MPTCVTLPPATSLTTIAPVPANTRQNVPMTSAMYFFISAATGAKALHILRQLGHVVFATAETFNQFAMKCSLRRSQLVVHPKTVAASFHQPGLLQIGKMPRCRGLRYP